MRKLHLTNRGELLIAGVCVILSLMGYLLYGWLTKSDISFTTRSPEVEVHHEFDAASIIESVADGKKEDVQIDTSKLNKDIVGEYPVIYKYKKEKIEITVSVVDSEAPTFDVKEVEIDLGMKVEAKQAVENLQDASDTKIS
ncbi:MAG: hypothetical protein ACK5LC_06230 [Coprobacillaceae bacterium]